MKIGFISKGDAVRGPIAEAITKKLLKDIHLKAEVFSAGVEPEKEINPLTIKVLEEKGYPVKGLYPKHISKIPYKKLDVVVILDPEIKDKCEFVISHKRRENWNIERPKETLEAFRKVRDEIEELVKSLLKI